MKTKILMVCLGNICRSPLAEGILQSKLNPSIFKVDSCGTSNHHSGEKPDKRSIDIALKHGIDISHQRSTQFKTSYFQDYDFIYAMDSSNYQNIKKLAKDNQETTKVDLILNKLSPNENLEVPDPYYGGKEGFENVFQMLNEACEIIKKELNQTI